MVWSLIGDINTRVLRSLVNELMEFNTMQLRSSWGSIGIVTEKGVVARREVVGKLKIVFHTFTSLGFVVACASSLPRALLPHSQGPRT